MRYFTINLNEVYKEISGYKCTLTAYLPDNSPEIEPNRKNPCMLIMPGGGYHWVSDRENEPMALAFLGAGYAAFTLKYSCASDSAAKFPTQLLQACFAMKYIKDHAEEFNIDPGKVFAMGFSAGGHLCGSLGLLYKSKYVRPVMPDYEKARPAAMVLCYPVTSSGRHGHSGCFENLLDKTVSAADVSLENAVTGDAPPMFVWHTFEDSVVSVFNPLLLASAYAEKNVPFELHIFESGIHGLSLSDSRSAPPERKEHLNKDVAVWFDLLLNFLKRHVLGGNGHP
jgi:acetyl esterase/lipase